MFESDGNPLVAALYDPVNWYAERRIFPEHRRYLARDLSGSVLDLGAGTGAMFPYLARSEGIESLHAIEPDPHMRTRAEGRATDLDLDVTIRPAGAEDLPFEDDSMDAVVASMVMCTIPDLGATMDEVARVLRPGGELRVLEHVRGDGLLAAVQRLLTPLWRPVAGGCHLDRDTPRVLACDDRFDVSEFDRLEVGIAPIRPFVRGRLVRRYGGGIRGALSSLTADGYR